MVFSELVDYSNRLKNITSRNLKVELVVDFFKRLDRHEAEIGVDFICGRIRQGRLAIAWAGLSGLMGTAADKVRKSPSLIEVDEILIRAKAARGKEKVKVLSSLFDRLDKSGRKHLVGLILRDVQQGVAEGLVKIAIARFFGLKEEDIENANMHEPDLGRLFVYLLRQGKGAAKGMGVKLFRPVRPMLADIADSMDDIYEGQGDFALEYKLDGIRIQVHRKGDEVKIFSRHLKDITAHFPELVQIAKLMPVKEVILDGEAIGLGRDGKPLPFQILSRRITRKKDIVTLTKMIPVVPQFFDIIYVDGDELTKTTYADRWRVLVDAVRDKRYLIARSLPSTKSVAQRFLDESLANGNEGIMAKLLNAPYQAGKRGSLWFKIKSSYTIDCVILAAEWGHGRRTGWLSNLHLGILDETGTKFLMVGKTFKGVTDDMLRWFTENLPRIKVHEDAWTMHVRPEIVVEIKFNGVQKSPKYDSGYALRFARVKHIRNDKKASEINTILDLEKFAKIGGVDEL